MGRFVALIPLRGGSKSIPGKNIKVIAGKPLCNWIIEEALNVSDIEEIWVSTDSEEIVKVVSNIVHEKVHILMRPSELATDSASTESVMIHFAEKVDFDYLITLQATSPLTSSEDIERGIRKVKEGNLDSLLTGVRTKRFFWNSDGTALNYDPLNRPRRQDFEGSIVENGAFYITERVLLIETKCRLGGNIGILEMAEETATEIDEPSDWAVVETLLKRRINNSDILKNIKLFVMDVDGTLTDGGIYFSKEGEELKKFSTRDGHGLGILKSKGIELAIITSEDSPIVEARAKKLGIERVYLGIKEKLPILHSICKDLSISLENVAYIGDDLGDLECLQHVGFSAAPNDAVEEIRDNIHFKCLKNGGAGAVREVCDLIEFNGV